MRIGWVTGCDYERTQHRTVAKDLYGCCEAELLAVRDWPTEDHFDETDRAVLGATDELLTTGTLGDQNWVRCETALGRNASVDLVTAVCTWSLISTVARGLGIPPEDEVASWPPDGKASPAEASPDRSRSR